MLRGMGFGGGLSLDVSCEALELDHSIEDGYEKIKSSDSTATETFCDVTVVLPLTN